MKVTTHHISLALLSAHFFSLLLISLLSSCQEDNEKFNENPDLTVELVGVYKVQTESHTNGEVYDFSFTHYVTKVNDSTILLDALDGYPYKATLKRVSEGYLLTIPYEKVENFDFEGMFFEREGYIHLTSLGFEGHGCFDPNTLQLNFALKMIDSNQDTSIIYHKEVKEITK